jgi:phenylpropionate dioxygenase-like ring-hydroxylating dioxygenase large terminal subunit
MTLTQPRDMLSMIDLEKGLVNRRIFYDQEIYQLELERIFARAWNFMCHDSQIPNPGDFFMTFIGEDRVIVVRDNDGLPQVLVNSCRHRGNAVCRAEEGHATSFMCTYHGWTYDLKGALVGVPGFKEVYHEELDRENWGLIKAGRVETYKGFVFANMDATAISLDEYLGPVGRLGLDYIAERGTVRMFPGVQKYTIPCNWKLAVDNLFDWYHPALSHSSAFITMTPPPTTPEMRKAMAAMGPYSQTDVAMLGEYGQAIGGPLLSEEMKQRFATLPKSYISMRETPRGQAALGPVGVKTGGHPNIFPNLWIATLQGQFSLRLPKGPGHTEIWWFSFVEDELDEAGRHFQRNSSNHIFGPAGMLEQDDGENWGESTKGARGTVSSRYPLNYSMALGRDKVTTDEDGPPHIVTSINEHPQLWTYRAWAEWMAADSWDDLRANHSAVPRDTV